MYGIVFWWTILDKGVHKKITEDGEDSFCVNYWMLEINVKMDLDVISKVGGVRVW